MQLFRRNKLKRHQKQTFEEGKWCNVIVGRLPYPIECQSKKQLNIDGCKECGRFIEYAAWKKGMYKDVSFQIIHGVDMTKHPQITIE